MMYGRKITSKILIVLSVTLVLLVSCESPTSSVPDYNGNPGGVYLTGAYGRPIITSLTASDRLLFGATSFSTIGRGLPPLYGTYRFDGAILTLNIGGIKHDKFASFTGGTLAITGSGGWSEFLNGIWHRR
ncbi:MAG: hypothetical protein FWC64_11965 [Treponema sp.]|nr:hypothetical protein [Treponema sp.]